jgi:hypothetical protein
MDLMMEKVEFAGFEPDHSLKSTISRTFDAILGSAPSDSEPRAFLSRTKEGFKGVLRLSSRQGIFAVEATGRDAIELLGHLKARMAEQIGSWRGGRHLLGFMKI